MTYLDEFLDRNKHLAAEASATNSLMPSLPAAMPAVKALIITCADMRVDPAFVLGIHPGEAIVMRNIGGRITPGLLQQLGMLGRISQVASAGAPPSTKEFHLIVLQHTDCGITRLVNDREMLSGYFGVDDAQLDGKTVLDPRAAVTADVAFLRSVPALPANWLLSGLVCNMATGLVEAVVPPAPIRTA